MRHRRPVADALCDAGHRVTVHAGGTRIAAERVGAWRYHHVPVERFTFKPSLDFRLLANSFATMMRHPPQGLHLITLKPIIFGGLAAIAARLARRGPRRIVATVPGLGRLMSPTSNHSGAKAALARFLVSGAVRFLSLQRGIVFVFETNEDRDEWLRAGLVGTDNSEVIGGAGVDAALFHPAQGAHAGRPLRVLFAARLIRAKGLDIFLEAARRIAPSGDVEFLVAGMADPADPDHLDPHHLQSEPSIVFLGHVEEMPDLLRSADVVCLPTRYGEGVPRILIEAAACGVASIASDADGCTYVVKEDISGVLIARGDPCSMISATVEAIERYRDDRALLARHKAGALAVFRNGPFGETAVVNRIVQLLTTG